MHECAVCGGPMQFLGDLGRFKQYRCRDCGWEDREETPKEVEMGETIEAEEGLTTERFAERLGMTLGAMLKRR